MSKTILSVGIELATDDVGEATFYSKISLLDWDIILFRPDISSLNDYRSQYKGKTSLDENSSFHLKENCEHWRREIKQVIEAGKTVVVFLPPLQQVYVDTGERTFSGTGRNQKTTRMVAEYSNYQCLPFELKPINTTGSSIKLPASQAELLGPYWTEFGDISEYKVILTGDVAIPCLQTQAGDKTVGSIIRSKNSAGSLLLLPDIDFCPDHFVKMDGKKQVWTDEACQFAPRLLSAIVSIDKTLRNTGEITPEPAWAANHDFVLQREQRLRIELLEAEQKVEEAQKHKEKLLENLQSAGRLRALLYEKGKPLENAIIEALQILGFNAAPYKDASSEFDVVFESSEGRLIGEAEGKDTKAINVDKLRQLAMNINEDLQRDEISVSAKGVLFGNGYRLQPVSERGAQFTEKCISAARTSSTALVATADLFKVARYLSDHNDLSFATACREALLNAVGPESFPQLPSIDQSHNVETKEK